MIFGKGDFEGEWDLYSSVVNEADFPLRMGLVPLEGNLHANHGGKAAAFLLDAAKRGNEKILFHGIKFLSDGSFPAMSLRLNFPGYLDGNDGIRNDVPWEELRERKLNSGRRAFPSIAMPMATRPSMPRSMRWRNCRPFNRASITALR